MVQFNAGCLKCRLPCYTSWQTFLVNCVNWPAGKSKGKKKSKKKTADLDSVFAALEQNGHTENGGAEAEAVQPDPLTNGDHADDDEAAAFGKKKKKSSKSKRGEADKVCTRSQRSEAFQQ